MDDDKRICSLLKLKLEKDGKNKVIFAQEGLLGIALAKKEKPDLIILDIVMEGLQGNEVAKMLAERAETKDIPIIFLSSLITEGEVEPEGKFVGDKYLIPKTSDLNGIMSGIEKYIQKYL
ncbi:MAG: response regulator [Desulfosalsimonadaceae bacterium]